MNINKILIIRSSSIGDILLATPLLRLLRHRFQTARIDFIIKTQFHDLLRMNPLIDHIYTLDTREGISALIRLRKEAREQGYDLVIDIHNNIRSHYLRRIPHAHIVKIKKYKWSRFFLVAFGWNFYRAIVPVHQRYIDTVAHLGIVDDGRGLEFYPDPAVQTSMHSRLGEAGFDFDRPTVGVAPGASFATKRWPVENFAQVVKRMVDELKVQILLFGDTSDAQLTQYIARAAEHSVFDLAGKLTLMESACALAYSNVVLTNDTGLMHLATAFKISTVAIFGPTVRELGFFPVGANTSVIENIGLSCRPCTHTGRKTCPKKHFQCMREIKPDQVFVSVCGALKGQSRGC
ncbi:lipopolysaccharide heptosyltransferase II [candidate division KSB1 bacterium]|nr:lipopolysaccharide heptosyltransferase II [candidate division KSB1 bacterium]